jgi:nanoRNase/pAp phosphatase (c-di-AMP/oligoRNAs hydrolase)
MPDESSATTTPVSSTGVPSLPTVNAPDVEVPEAPAPSPVVAPTVPTLPTTPTNPAVENPATVATNATATTAATATTEAPTADTTEIVAEVVRKIGESHNVLVALSSDPSVDEMAAAIGISLYLDKLGKRATAIYSGVTPNALQFLKPEETFESSVDTLQDFVIALNKDKADHLRYKLDGDYVKIYITPYKTKIAENDLEFSYGDYNVDLVLALDVANGVDLDSALREHGRIMHDAVIVNITTGNPGKLGEIEWSDKSASSVSEMIAKLLYSIRGEVKIEKEEATAFLTGIVAATNRFSNAKTTPETMRLASRLMESGANQQLVSKNITPDIENELLSMSGTMMTTRGVDDDPTKLDIAHGNEKDVDETKEVNDTVTEKKSTLLDDLKAAEASLVAAGAETVPDKTQEPLNIDSSSVNGTNDTNNTEAEGFVSERPEKVIQPPSDMNGTDATVNDVNKYGQMLEDALASVDGGASSQMVNSSPVDASSAVSTNPAASGAPVVPTNPEINGVPEINYMPMPGEAVLPPPPTPPIDMNGSMPIGVGAVEPIAPATPAAEPTLTSLGSQPSMQDQVYGAQAADPGAFKIPGV